MKESLGLDVYLGTGVGDSCRRCKEFSNHPRSEFKLGRLLAGFILLVSLSDLPTPVGINLERATFNDMHILKSVCLVVSKTCLSKLLES